MNGYGMRLQLFPLGSDVALGAGQPRPPLSFFIGAPLPLSELMTPLETLILLRSLS